MNPDRTVSKDGRIIWDGRVHNARCPKEDHPPAGQPRHRNVTKEILWWQHRHPGLKILLSKMDIAEAFRWIWLLPQDACVFATELGGYAWGLSQQIIAIYLVLTFGWTGSPGEFGVWAWVVKLLHQAFRPSDARWADDVCFHSQFLVDDMVLIESDLGRRPFESARLARLLRGAYWEPRPSMTRRISKKERWRRRSSSGVSTMTRPLSADPCHYQRSRKHTIYRTTLLSTTATSES